LFVRGADVEVVGGEGDVMALSGEISVQIEVSFVIVEGFKESAHLCCVVVSADAMQGKVDGG
jgi:hypothetical protein